MTVYVIPASVRNLKNSKDNVVRYFRSRTEARMTSIVVKLASITANDCDF